MTAVETWKQIGVCDHNHQGGTRTTCRYMCPCPRFSDLSSLVTEPVGLLSVQESMRYKLRTGLIGEPGVVHVEPFASTHDRSAETLILVSRAVGSFIKLYLLLLFVRVLLSWFPKFEWDTQPWLALRQVCSGSNPLFKSSAQMDWPL